jgi:hypothetical protein
MTQPVRIQLSRRGGFRLQDASRAINGLPAVRVARPSIWGNPYRVGQRGQFVWEPMTDEELLAFDFSERDVEIGGQTLRCRPMPPNRIIPFDQPLTIEDVLLLYHKHVRDKQIDLAPLRGRNLACWCRLDAKCHADILLALANGDPSPNAGVTISPCTAQADAEVNHD